MRKFRYSVDGGPSAEHECMGKYDVINELFPDFSKDLAAREAPNGGADFLLSDGRVVEVRSID